MEHTHTHLRTHTDRCISVFSPVTVTPTHPPPTTTTTTIPSTHSVQAKRRFCSAIVTLESCEHNCPKFGPVPSLSGVTVEKAPPPSTCKGMVINTPHIDHLV